MTGRGPMALELRGSNALVAAVDFYSAALAEATRREQDLAEAFARMNHDRQRVDAVLDALGKFLSADDVESAGARVNLERVYREAFPGGRR